jgi:His-Xaa-Ser system radical SAM maturase HxsC
MLEYIGIPHHIQSTRVARVCRVEEAAWENTPTLWLLDREKLSAFQPNEHAMIATPANIHEIPQALVDSDIPIVAALGHADQLAAGDVVFVQPDGRVVVIYSSKQEEATLFVTGMCNSNCIMCSQPPAANDAVGLFELNKLAVHLIESRCREIGITGGEPTRLGVGLLDLIAGIKKHLPATRVHVLTNGRCFAKDEVAKSFAAVNHPLLSVGIPLYAHNAAEHDSVSRVKGAFLETVLGLHALARHHARIELRIVLMRQTIHALSRIAEYVWNNLPFVQQVALMGMEPIGFGWENRTNVWMDPADYQQELEAAVEYLGIRGMNVVIFNEQRCVLRPSLWKFARKSISYWKRIYLPECDYCNAQEKCGGFFESGRKLHSRSIRPMKDHCIYKGTM